MKYRVTEKHPELKKDVHIKKTKKGYYIGIDDANFLITDDMTAEWLDDKWIEEIQEPELNPKWIQKMILIDDILKMYNLDDIEALKKILERA